MSQAGAYIGQGRTLITGSSSTDSPVTAPLVQSEPTPTEPTPLADYPVQEELIEELEQPVSSDSTAEETINELTTEIERIIEDGELTPVVVDAPPAVPSINTGPLTFTLG